MLNFLSFYGFVYSFFTQKKITGEKNVCLLGHFWPQGPEYLAENEESNAFVLPSRGRHRFQIWLGSWVRPLLHPLTIPGILFFSPHGHKITAPVLGITSHSQCPNAEGESPASPFRHFFVYFLPKGKLFPQHLVLPSHH